MIPHARLAYNQSFSEEKYQLFLTDLHAAHDFAIKFRVAETPVFIPAYFRNKLLRASNDIIDFLVRPDFKQLTNPAIPAGLNVPNETDHTLFLALDYAIVKDTDGSYTPRLIEMQGFPSLFAFQDFLGGKYRQHFTVPAHFQNHFVGSAENYRSLLKKALLGNAAPENTVLLEIDPLQQNTAIDFVITEKLTGIRPVHLGDVQREGRKLFYQRDGKRVPIHRIYNRVIFDELIQRTDLSPAFDLTQEVDVEWAGHPNWFFRISKFTMPLIQSAFIPSCQFLSEVREIPADLENYVLKPLFSFSGSGVIFHVTPTDIHAIPEKERGHYMLQQKVSYEPVVQAPDGKVKTEIRLLFLWMPGEARPTLVTNLARLSRGEMIGVKFNKDKTWVGGSVCFFEP
ncbi:MAG: hypothetical protein MUC38_10635 [Cyclobacteriaceae bacterium]|jgi:hypothetical protein|nr:hypothetical protein [Cyclobacteriaceae bacterium]